jgi:hypothetical protein
MADSVSRVLSEIIQGDALGMGAAARLIPKFRGGEGHARPSTIWRWIVSGSKTPTGSIVRLESARIGNRWLTSRKALERFFTTLTEASAPTSTDPTPPVSSPRSLSAKRKRSEAAARKLEAMGA